MAGLVPPHPGPLVAISTLGADLGTTLMLGVIVAAGHRVARIRLERFVTGAWAVLIPLALIDVLASGALAL